MCRATGKFTTANTEFTEVFYFKLFLCVLCVLCGESGSSQIEKADEYA